MKKLIIVICFVIVLGVVGFIMWNDRVVSTITMDINPSIKLEFNKKNIIKNAIALNEDANKIVDNLKDRTLDDALYTLVGNLINEKIVDESGLLDSYAFIELFTMLEDYGIVIQPTRIDRNKLRTVEGIKELIKEYTK